MSVVPLALTAVVVVPPPPAPGPPHVQLPTVVNAVLVLVKVVPVGKVIFTMLPAADGSAVIVVKFAT